MQLKTPTTRSLATTAVLLKVCRAKTTLGLKRALNAVERHAVECKEWALVEWVDDMTDRLCREEAEHAYTKLCK